MSGGSFDSSFDSSFDIIYTPPDTAVSSDLGSGAPPGTSKANRLMRILLKPFQRLENAFQQLLLRSVATSTGVMLTQLGKLVGQPRNGITDDEVFRRYVRARIATNKSRMIGDDIITVANLVIGDPNAVVVVKTLGEAAYEITVTGIVMSDSVATILLTFLRPATGSGISFNLITYPALDSGMFAFNGGTGLGFGDALNAATGGEFASGRDNT